MIGPAITIYAKKYFFKYPGNLDSKFQLEKILGRISFLTKMLFSAEGDLRKTLECM